MTPRLFQAVATHRGATAPNNTFLFIGAIIMRMKLIAILLLFFSFQGLAAEPSPNVVGGSDASINDAPWQAFLRIGSNFCGGVVISSRWILTAAHCLDTADDDDPFSLASANSVSVYTGTAEINGANFSSFQSSVDSIYTNSSYNKDTLQNDIALVKLSSDVHPNASTVVLPNDTVQAAVDATGNLNNNDMQLTGWGYTDTGRSQSTNTLQKATLSALSDATCASQWGTTLTNVSDYQSKYFCAQASGVGACNGDSGGPLIWYDPSRAGDADGGATLIGLVSFGVASQCASPTVPDVFTQVASYTDWVSDCQSGSCASQSSVVMESNGGGGSLGILFILSLVLSRLIFGHYHRVQ
ncbi:serine protease [Grimontia kaedaensis]|uniref:Serine protease n=2 Tax=Grimontia kaedaensis TaxID=2872157 RepID=A0ABY4WTG9_9GAMM|nr:serine protease [Grimontia kaedaensis]